MRIARALDHRGDAHEDALVRLGTAIGKYWICKRAPRPRLRGDGMHRRLRGDGGFADAAPLSRGAGQRDLGGQRQRPVPRHRPRASSARRRRWRPISPRSARRRGEQRRARRPCRGAEGRPRATSTISRAAPATSATGWRSGLQAAALVRAALAGRRGLLPLAARGPRRAPLRRADRGRRQGDRQAGGGAVGAGSSARR